MKRILLLLALLLAFRTTMQAQNEIPNPGFESWSAGNPVNWTSTNTGFTNNITQSSVARTGSSSAKGEIILFSGVPFPPGLTAGGITQRVSISQNHSAVTGHYQFYPHVPALTMSLYVSVNFFDAQSQLTAQGTLLLPFGTTSSWQPFSVPMNYSVGNGNPSAFANIQFTISGTGNPAPADRIGSYFLLDDVGLAPPTSVSEQGGAIPVEFFLEQNFPNPFNPSTNIRFSLPEQSLVRLTVFNLLGEEVATLANEVMAAGKYAAEWNGAVFPSGVYIYTLSANGRVFTKKMILAK